MFKPVYYFYYESEDVGAFVVEATTLEKADRRARKLFPDAELPGYKISLDEVDENGLDVY